MNLDTPELEAKRERNRARFQAESRETMAGMLARWKRMQATPAVPVTAPAPATPDGGPDCPVCQNYRFVTDDAGNTKPCPSCRVVEQRIVAKLDAYSSANGRAETQTFENFDVSPSRSLVECLSACKAFAANPAGWLVLYGTMGNGKSHLCAATANALRASGRGVVFVTMPDLVQSLKSLFDERTADEENDTYSHRLRVYQTAPILIVDDLGAERATDWSQGLQFEIFNSRYRDRLPTMFTTNYRPDDASRFDARLIDRWKETGFCRVVYNAAPSRRGAE